MSWWKLLLLTIGLIAVLAIYSWIGSVETQEGMVILKAGAFHE